MDNKDIDPLLWDVAKYVVDNNTPSLSVIQREFHIGYNRTRTLFEYMEMMDIIAVYRLKLIVKIRDHEQLSLRIDSLKYWNSNRQLLQEIAPEICVIKDGHLVKSEAKIDGYNCQLFLTPYNNELTGVLTVEPHFGPGIGEKCSIEPLISQNIKIEFQEFFTNEERYSLTRRFFFEYNEEVFDWYKKVLDKFMLLDETAK